MNILMICEDCEEYLCQITNSHEKKCYTLHSVVYSDLNQILHIQCLVLQEGNERENDEIKEEISSTY